MNFYRLTVNFAKDGFDRYIVLLWTDFEIVLVNVVGGGRLLHRPDSEGERQQREADSGGAAGGAAGGGRGRGGAGAAGAGHGRAARAGVLRPGRPEAHAAAR